MRLFNVTCPKGQTDPLDLLRTRSHQRGYVRYKTYVDLIGGWLLLARFEW